MFGATSTRRLLRASDVWKCSISSTPNLRLSRQRSKRHSTSKALTVSRQYSFLGFLVQAAREFSIRDRSPFPFHAEFRVLRRKTPNETAFDRCVREIGGTCLDDVLDPDPKSENAD